MTKSEFFKMLSESKRPFTKVFKGAFDKSTCVVSISNGFAVKDVARCKTEEKADSELVKFTRWFSEWEDENVKSEPAPEKIEPGKYEAKIADVKVHRDGFASVYKCGDKLVNAVTQISKIKKEKSLERQFIRAAKVFFKKNKMLDSKHVYNSLKISNARDFGLSCLQVLIEKRATDIAMKAYIENCANDVRDHSNYSFYKFMSYRKNWFEGLAREDILLWWHKNYAMENIISLACCEN